MKKLFKFNTIIAIMLALFMASAFMAPNAGAESWKQKFVRFAGTAGETLTVGDPVCIAAADGQVYKADANSSTRRPAVGVIGKGGAAEATVEIVAIGILTGQTAASPGARIYVSDGAGVITTTAPTNAQVLGWVMTDNIDTATSTTYFILTLPEPSGGAAF
jgi:hypothetical protein